MITPSYCQYCKQYFIQSLQIKYNHIHYCYNKKMEIKKEENYSPKLKFSQSWMLYSKENVLDKLNESIDTLLKYYKTCYEKNMNILKSEKMNDYCFSRLLNINNLIYSLVLHDDFSSSDYEFWKNEVYGEIEEEFEKNVEEVNWDERTDKLQDFLDDTLELPFFLEDQGYDEDDDDTSDTATDTGFISDFDCIPDNASIIQVGDESKKRKKNQF